MTQPAAPREWLRGALLLALPALLSASQEAGPAQEAGAFQFVIPTRAPTLEMSVILSCALFATMALLTVVKPNLAPAAWSKLRARGLGLFSIGHVGLVLCTISMFMIIGPALMMLNKHIMQEMHFPYPLSLSGLGLLASICFSRAAVGLGYATVRPESLEVVSGTRWLKTALPIGACKAVTLATGNSAYLYLGLGFIQMLKAFTPAVVLVVMRICGTAGPSKPAVFFVFVIVAGTMVEVKGELQATALGMCVMLLSEVTEASGLVLTQKLLQTSKFTVMEALYVLAPPQAMCLFGAAVLLEWPTMLRTGSLEILTAHPSPFIGAAVLGLAVNFVGMMLVQATSSLFCKILNTVRCVGLVCIGSIFYGEEIGLMEICGYGISLFGFAGYNYVQMFPDRGDRLEHAVSRRCCCKGNAYLQVDREDTEDFDKSSPGARGV